MKHLVSGAREMGIVLSEDQIAAFQAYYELLTAWNERANLTRITGYQEVQTGHFLDSLSCLPVILQAGVTIDQNTRLIDVGAGAGLPGLPLKITHPALRLTLLEATGKKADFLRAVVERLGLAGVDVVNARAEEAGRETDQRQQYHLAMARAVAAMPTLAELTLPFVRLGGLVIAQKGTDPGEEVKSAHKAIHILGGRVRCIQPVVVPGLQAERHVVVLEKVSPTPERYPRRPGIPAKRPL